MMLKRPAKKQKTTSLVSELTESFIDKLKREQIDYQYNELELDDFYLCENLESIEWLDSVRASIASPPNVDLSKTFDHILQTSIAYDIARKFGSCFQL